jgi:hypothetical protein
MKHITALTGCQFLDRAPARLVAALRKRRSRNPRPLASAYSRPDGAGPIGPGADSLLRAVLVQALTSPDPVEVLMTKHDLQRLFGERADRVPRDRLHDRLRVTDSLEDSVEYVEERAAGVSGGLPILWMVTPGADADVVRRALEGCPARLLTGLFRGPWPYGPTYLIEQDGPRPRTRRRPIRLLSPKQAVATLQAATSQP